MEVYELETEVKIFYVQAISFPDGIKKAWEDLHKILPVTEGRNFYGISHGSAEGIVYKAAVAEHFPGEAKLYKCKEWTMPRGEYLAITVYDYMSHLPLIGQAFRRLMAHPDFDGITSCIEWYKTDREVVCMVKKAVVQNLALAP